MGSISVEDLMLLNHPLVVDIREEYYYYLGHIPGARSIPYYHLYNNYSHYLKLGVVYYVYCENGEQSSSIVSRLNSFGYNMVNINGGYKEYLRIFGND